MVNIKDNSSFSEYIENNSVTDEKTTPELKNWANIMQWMFNVNGSVYKVLAEIKDDGMREYIRKMWKKYYDAEYKRKMRKGKSNHLNINIKSKTFR